MLSRIAHSLIGTRLSIGSVRQVISERFDRRILAFGVIIIAAVTFQHYFVFGVNATPSLPHTLYLIHKGEPIGRGDLIAFRWAGGGPYIAGITFVKIAAGVPGDTISRHERDYYVNGLYVGTAKRYAKDGAALALMDTGVLNADEYYVQAPHLDSLDSRYRLTGWIAANRIIGRAYALF